MKHYTQKINSLVEDATISIIDEISIQYKTDKCKIIRELLRKGIKEYNKTKTMFGIKITELNVNWKELNEIEDIPCHCLKSRDIWNQDYPPISSELTSDELFPIPCMFSQSLKQNWTYLSFWRNADVLNSSFPRPDFVFDFVCSLLPNKDKEPIKQRKLLGFLCLKYFWFYAHFPL